MSAAMNWAHLASTANTRMTPKRQELPQTVHTAIPGRPAIPLFSFYDEFRDYYPSCELQTKRWFVQNVEPDWQILDAGANIGYYSILFSQLASQGRVIAFEPTATVEMLKTNLSRNGCGNVIVEQAALGNVTGRREEAIFRIWGKEPERLDYEFETIDHYCKRKDLQRIDCIKIDTDSFDFEVLQGAEQVLRKFNPWVVVELNHALTKRGQSAPEALEWLNRRGYFEALVLDYDNFVLRRRARGPSREAGMRLFFDQHLVARDTNFDLGSGVDDAIRAEPVLHNQAHFSSYGSDDRNCRVVVPGPRWQFALAYGLQQPAADPGTVVVRVAVRVDEGTIGVGCLRADGTGYVAPEAHLRESASRQEARILLSRLSDSPTLMFRNADPSGRTSIFSLLEMGVYRAVPAPARSVAPYMEPRARRIELSDLGAALRQAGPLQSPA